MIVLVIVVVAFLLMWMARRSQIKSQMAMMEVDDSEPDTLPSLTDARTYAQDILLDFVAPSSDDDDDDGFGGGDSSGGGASDDW